MTVSLREPVNAISHMLGGFAAFAGLTLLIVFASVHATVWHIVSFSIYGSSLLMMYTASSVYHSLKISEEGIRVLRKIDHMMIFLLIAGSYTPICLVPLRGVWGWSIFGTVWGIAVTGIILKLFFINMPRWVSTAIYLVMGWICIVAIVPLVKSVQTGCMMWLLAGGLFYSGGAVIYALKRPNIKPDILGFHEIWHIFVLLGSGCHFWAMFRYVMYLS
ncbi:hemolysin [Desulfonema ishimotonii]|uniref:Hemolysin n=1 Tax=Desulfonema ishimotonii TaxID=45657 RepID=A0A401FU88_9BACT|nr:hemolysin III family protein [Desulfonema ishimotonii]GBC60523.1 hemolysin [Desulfonema ishimotonii]